MGFTQIYTGGDSSGIPCYASMKGKLYRVNGYDGLLRYDSALNGGDGGFETANVGAPGTAPTWGALGMENGGEIVIDIDQTIVAKYTYYNSAEGVETEASSTVTYTAVADWTDGKIKIKVSGTSETQVDYIRIYRTVPGAPATFYREDEIANPGAGTNNGNTYLTMSADDLVQCPVYEDTHVAPFADSLFITAHENRMLVVRRSERFMLYFSESNMPEYLPTDNAFYMPTDQGTIDYMFPYGQTTILFRKTGIQVLAGNSADTFRTTELRAYPGLLARNTVCLLPRTGMAGMMVYLSRSGLVGYVGGDPIDCSYNIKDIIDEADESDLDDAWGLVLTKPQLYLLHLKDSSTSSGWRVLAMHYGLGRDQYGQYIWTPWDTAHAMTLGDSSEESCDEVVVFMIGANVMTWQTDRFNDAGSNIKFRVKMRENDYGKPGSVKGVKGIGLNLTEPYSASQTGTARVYAEGSSTAYATATVSMSDAESWRRLTGRGKRLSLEIEETGNELVEIGSISLDVEDTGRRGT